MLKENLHLPTTESRKDTDPDTKASDRSFFEETSLHGLKYLSKHGRTRVIWINVVAICVIVLIIFANSTLSEFWTSPMRIQVNSTNTPLNLADFPVVTFCPNNVISTEKAKKANKTDADLRTVLEYKEYAQSCSDFMRVCTLHGMDCQSHITQVITDMGWCCQLDVLDVLDSEKVRPGEVGMMGLDIIFDIESYNYMKPNCFFDGILFRAIPRGSYPNMLSKFSALSPGTTAYVNMKLVKISTTDDAREKSVQIRNCVFPGEIKLDHFEVYTQDNCYTDQIINQFKEKCGCIGIYRGFNSASDVPECTFTGSLAWRSGTEYQECLDNGYNKSSIILAAGCPSQCLAPCQEDQISLEISTGSTPGFQALCGNEPTPDDKLACMLGYFGVIIYEKLCDTLDLFTDDEYELYTRAPLCDETFQKVHKQCKTSHENPGLKLCLQGLNLSVKDRRRLEEVVNDYARSNVISARLSFSEKYYTSIERDVSYTVQSLICNIGGLLGLCLGCSFVSIIEIVFFCCKLLPCKLPMCN